MSLTGRFNFRRTWTGKIVLQVEEEVQALWPFGSGNRKRWRDANLLDLATPEMRALIDLRYKPQFMPQRYYAPAEAGLAQGQPDGSALGSHLGNGHADRADGHDHVRH
jgi:hypothetical protein